MNERIAKNIKTLLEIKGISYSQLQKKIEKEEGYTISPAHLNKVLNHPAEYSMPLPYLMQCCDFLRNFRYYGNRITNRRKLF